MANFSHKSSLNQKISYFGVFFGILMQFFAKITNFFVFLAFWRQFFDKIGSLSKKCLFSFIFGISYILNPKKRKNSDFQYRPHGT